MIIQRKDEIVSPEFEGTPLYEYNIDENWVLVESAGGREVYAYGGEALTVLAPGESTTPLLDSVSMKQITNAEYAGIDDINIFIAGYAIDANGDSVVPIDVWDKCKLQIG